MENELHPKLHKFILKLQKIRSDNVGVFYDDYPPKVIKQIEEIGQTIKDEKLIEQSENSHWAKQLMIMNDVPDKYWK